MAGGEHPLRNRFDFNPSAGTLNGFVASFKAFLGGLPAIRFLSFLAFYCLVVVSRFNPLRKSTFSEGSEGSPVLTVLPCVALFACLFVFASFCTWLVGGFVPVARQFPACLLVCLLACLYLWVVSSVCLFVCLFGSLVVSLADYC